MSGDKHEWTSRALSTVENTPANRATIKTDGSEVELSTLTDLLDRFKALPSHRTAVLRLYYENGVFFVAHIGGKASCRQVDAGYVEVDAIFGSLHDGDGFSVSALNFRFYFDWSTGLHMPVGIKDALAPSSADRFPVGGAIARRIA